MDVRLNPVKVDKSFYIRKLERVEEEKKTLRSLCLQYTEQERGVMDSETTITDTTNLYYLRYHDGSLSG